MAVTEPTTRFQYRYEDTPEESIEASLAILREQIDLASKWRPPVLLLIVCGVGGGVAAVLASTVSGKLIALGFPIALAILLTISSKQTRIEIVRQQFESILRRNYNEKKCHVHDLTICDSGLVETCPCGTDTRNWQAIKRWHETERMLVLEALNKTFYAIPKRVIPSEDLQPLRDLVSRHLKQENASTL